MYEIKYHPGCQKSVEKIPANMKECIRKAIDKRLKSAPNQYGKPLHSSLAGYRRLRVRDYRIIYFVVETAKIVHILEISNRNDVMLYD